MKMNKGIWLIFGVFLVLALSQNVSALTTIDSCQTLSSNDDYALNASITTDTSGSCFSLSSGGNITLDGSGFSITMNGTGSVLSFQDTNNVSIVDLIIDVTSSPLQTIVLVNANNTAMTDSVANVMNCSSDKRLFNRDFHGAGINLTGNNFSVCGNLWAGLGDIDVNIIGNNWLMNCSDVLGGGYGTLADIGGKHINFSYNNVNTYCDNNTAGSFYFSDFNDSYVGFDIFTGHDIMSEPFTFHRVYMSVFENLVINTTGITDFGTGMTGRFCCGTDNIFRNSKLYLNKPLNIYAVNSIGNNITWDNIEHNCYGTCGMVIHDYDNVTIKNSIFSGNNISISGIIASPFNNTLRNLIMDNVTSNGVVKFQDVVAGRSWNLTNSYFGGGVLLANASNALLLKSSYFNYSIGNNLQLDSASNFNVIYNNTFNRGNVTDSGTGNVYCVNGVGNAYTGGSSYFGSSLGTCFSTYITSCQTLLANRTYVLNSSITASVSSSCLNMSLGMGGNVTVDGNGFGITITGTGRAISLTGVTNITVKNLTVNGTYVAGYGIYLSNVNVSVIDNVNVTAVKSGTSGAVYGIDLNNVTFRNSYLYGNNGTDFVFQRVNHVDIVNNVFLHDVGFPLAASGFLHNVTFLNFSGNIVNKTVVQGDQLVHCNGWINDSVFSRNTFTGLCSFGAICSSFSVPSRVEIFNNSISANCNALQFGRQYYSGSPNFPISGYFNIYNNFFNLTDLSACTAVSMAGGNAIRFYNNTCYAQSTAFSLTFFNNVSLVHVHDNKYTFTGTNMSVSRNALSFGTSGMVNFGVTNFTIENENILTPFPAYGFQIVNISANISNSNLSGKCAGIRGLGTYPSVVNVYNSVLQSDITPCPSNIDNNLYVKNLTLGGVFASNASIVNLYNTTMNDFANITAYHNSAVNVYWNLNILNPINASVNLYNLQNSLLSSFTGNNALWVRQFFQNASGRTTTTPNSIQLSKSGYYAKTDSVNMNTNKDYTISMRLIVPLIDPSSITGQLVMTLGFGIMGLFAVLTLLGFGYLESTGKPDPETIAKIMIGITIIILMIVAVWSGIVLPP